MTSIQHHFLATVALLVWEPDPVFTEFKDDTQLKIFPNDLSDFDGETLRWPVGKSLSLTCQLDSLVPLETVKLEWYLPHMGGRDIESTKTSYRSTVRMQNVSAGDAGSYSCKATYRKETSDELRSTSKNLRVSVMNDILKAGQRPCLSGFFKCASDDNDLYCIADRYVCDGFPDCFDGSDETVDLCGHDVCQGKFRCGEEARCMDPSLCCDPYINKDCLLVIPCCQPLIESNRELLYNKLHNKDSGGETDGFYMTHAASMTIIGALAALCFLAVLLALAIYKTASHQRSAMAMSSFCCTKGSSSSGSSEGPPNHLSAAGGGGYHQQHGFASLHQYDPEYALAVMAAPPPSYNVTYNDPPPPYENHVEDADTSEESNNNGDMNGNSEPMMVVQNQNQHYF